MSLASCSGLAARVICEISEEEKEMVTQKKRREMRMVKKIAEMTTWKMREEREPKRREGKGKEKEEQKQKERKRKRKAKRKLEEKGKEVEEKRKEEEEMEQKAMKGETRFVEDLKWWQLLDQPIEETAETMKKKRHHLHALHLDYLCSLILIQKEGGRHD